MKLIKIAFILTVILMVASCKKLQEKWIVGEWKVEDLERGDEESYWVFKDDNTVMFIRESAFWAASIDTLHAEWAIKSKLGNYIEIKGDNKDTQLDGKFYIEKLNSKKVLLTRREFISGEKGGAYLRRELYK